MSEKTIRDLYEDGELDVQKILRGKTPPKVSTKKINLVKPEKIKLVKFKKKKHGGKIIYKMTGGQIVDACYD